MNSLEARKHIHPELEEIPEEEQRFRQHLMILTQYLVAEADDVIRTEEITAIEKNTDPNELIYLENELGWKRGQNGNTEDVASWVFGSAPEPMQSRHAAEILYSCLTTSYSDGEQCEREFDVIISIAEKLEIEPPDFFAIHNKVRELVENTAQDEEVYV